jgi:Xaa-Pro aminopeptidase
MKQDIDRLMHDYEIEALWVIGEGRNNPAMVYLTGGTDLSQADLIKKRDQTAVLFHSPIERDAAHQTGLPTFSYAKFHSPEILKTAGGDPLEVSVLRHQRMFEELDIRQGRVAVYGITEASRSYGLISRLQSYLPEIQFVGAQKNDVLTGARMTKDEEEIRRIRNMGKITVEVASRITELLMNSAAEDEVLVRPDGLPLTIGDVKRQIKAWLAERDAETIGTIFALGREAAVPHNQGDPRQSLQLGTTIVFDAPFREIGGGYFYDFTRTWCLGYASEEAQKAYEDVYDVYEHIILALKPNTPFYEYQKMACELFEARGHPTVGSQHGTTEGYVHGLGHGVGLEIHEQPMAASMATDDLLLPGSVVTIEPGLYYPNRNFGIRIEDTVYINPQGEVEILADYPKDLVLPVKTL